MRFFYLFLTFILFQFPVFGQKGKPLYQPSSQNKNQKVKIKPIQTTYKGNNKARTSSVTTFQPKTLPVLKSKLQNTNLKVVERSISGLPIMIKGNLDKSSKGRAINEQVYDYLKAVKNVIQIKSPVEEFVIIDKKTDELGQLHIKLAQQYKGVKVYGGEVWLHAQKGAINLFNGRNFPSPKLNQIQPSISKEHALNIANQDVSLKTKVKTLSDLEKKLIGVQKNPELVIYHPTNTSKPYLTWHFDLHPNVANAWEYFVDAQSGEILEAYKTLCQLHYNPSLSNSDECHNPIFFEKEKKKNNSKSHQHFLPQNGPATAIGTDLNDFNRTVHSYELGGNYFLIDASRSMFNASRSELPNDPVGAIWTINAQNKYPNNDDFDAIHVVTNNNSWDDPASVSAHYNAGIAYDYFRNTFSRNSINGNGGTIISLINVSDEDGSSLENAFWSGSAMFYGNGGNQFLPLAKSLDVAGHEMSHGVIQNTANLRYQGESGAMNESFADVFGVLIDRDDYLLGEDVVNPNIFRSGALRNVADPHNGGTRLGDAGWQPSHVSEQYLGREDNGGVHINSGITNRAFFLIANTIGRDKAEQMYYRALTTYLVSTSQFVDLRASLLQAATDIHGGGSNEVAVVAAAFDQVGILGNNTGSGSESGGAQEVEIEASSGDDFVIYTDDARANLYLADGEGNIIASPFTDSGILSRPSITDDGSAIVFVAADKTIHLILIDWENEGAATEEVIQDQPIWRNVAVSRDGFRIAALQEEQTNQIEVFDFTLEAWKVFDLYNPTFTEGITTGEVQYADVIEFDFTGQYVMYDAFNSISGAFGADDIEYWDIGFLKVYDNALDNFEQNEINNIEKLFSGLSENISIGNPTFSKNSPNIIAYEYIDAFNTTEDSEQIYELRGLNLTTRAEETIFRNRILNVPSYGRLDDRLIFNGQIDQSGESVVAVIGLADNKIAPDGGAGVLISQTPGAQLGVWFSDGSRQLTATNDLEKSVLNFRIRPNPFQETIAIEFIMEQRKELEVEIYNTLGQRQLGQIHQAIIGKNFLQIPTQQLPEGTYFVSLKSDEGVISRKIVKQ